MSDIVNFHRNMYLWYNYLKNINEKNIKDLPDPDTIIKLGGPATYQWYYLLKNLSLLKNEDISAEEWLLLSITKNAYFQNIDFTQQFSWTNHYPITLFEYWSPKHIPWNNTILTQKDIPSDLAWLYCFIKNRNYPYNIEKDSILTILSEHQHLLKDLNLKDKLLNIGWSQNIKNLLITAIDLGIPLKNVSSNITYNTNIDVEFN